MEGPAEFTGLRAWLCAPHLTCGQLSCVLPWQWWDWDSALAVGFQGHGPYPPLCGSCTRPRGQRGRCWLDPGCSRSETRRSHSSGSEWRALGLAKGGPGLLRSSLRGGQDPRLQKPRQGFGKGAQMRRPQERAQTNPVCAQETQVRDRGKRGSGARGSPRRAEVGAGRSGGGGPGEWGWGGQARGWAPRAGEGQGLPPATSQVLPAS